VNPIHFTRQDQRAAINLCRGGITDGQSRDRWREGFDDGQFSNAFTNRSEALVSICMYICRLP